MPGPAGARAAWTQPELRPLSRPAEPVRVTSSWRPAVWPVRRDEADWGCSPRSWPKVAVRWRTAVRQASARALVRAAAVVGPAAAVSPAVLQPPAVEALSRALPELSRRVGAPATARALRRHNPRSEDRTGRPRCALPDSNLTHRSQALPLADVPHLERSRRSESLRRAHRCSPARALKPGSVRIRSQIGSTRSSMGVIRLPFMRNCCEIRGTACAASPFIAWILAR